MALDFDADPLAELSLFRELEVDGVFVDCPATAAEWLATQHLTPTSWIGSVIGGSGGLQQLPLLLDPLIGQRTYTAGPVLFLYSTETNKGASCLNASQHALLQNRNLNGHVLLVPRDRHRQDAYRWRVTPKRCFQVCIECSTD